MECGFSRKKLKLLIKHLLVPFLTVFLGSMSIQLPKTFAQQASSSILDFDGDGITDPGTYSFNFGRMTIRWLRSVDDTVAVAKIDGVYAVPANYLGNGRSQPAAVQVRSGILYWNILDPNINKVYSIRFGKAGDTIISGCHFMSSTQASLSFIRGRTLYIRKINGNTKNIRLRELPRGDFVGCGDTNGDGLDELIARAPGKNGSSIANSIFIFSRTGVGKIFKQVKTYSNLIAVKRSNSSNVPLVILARGLASDSPGVKVEALRGTFNFPILPLSDRTELTSGVFMDTTENNLKSGLLWRPKGENRIIQRLLVDNSKDTEIFRIWSLERLLKSINVRKTSKLR